MTLPESLLSNLGWKATSLALATLIWTAIHFSSLDVNSPAGRNPVVSTLPVRRPVSVMTAAADTRVFRVSPDTVEVTLGGEAGELENLKESEVQVFITLKDVADSRTLRRQVQVYPPGNLRVVHILPAEVDVTVLPETAPADVQPKNQP